MKSKILKIASIFNAVGFLSALIGMIISNEYSNYFIWLVFYFPFLWLFWILCVFTAQKENFFASLIGLWLVIDISILFFFIMLAKGVPDWANSRGIEMVMGTIYFPVVVPTGFFINFLPTFEESLSSKLLPMLVKIVGNGVSNALSVWLLMSWISTIQSFVLMGMAYWLLKRKNHKSKIA
jgi:hypothetical protein